MARALAAAVLALAIADVASAAEDRPPVELYNPEPRYPPEAGNLRTTPEITVEVEVDADGKVTAVHVVDVSPSTEKDFLFEEAMISTVSTWRYAPKIENGTAVPTTLRWTQTHFGSIGNRDERSRWDDLLGLTPRAEDRFRGLGMDDRKSLLADQLSTGLGLMTSVEVAKVTGERVVVHSDAGASTAQAVANNLEAAFNLLAEVLGGRLPLEPEELKLQVLVFADRAAYLAFEQQAFQTERLSAGFYTNLGLVAFHLAMPTRDDVLAVLLHEGTHAFVDQHLLRDGVRLPAWLMEGLAEYIEGSEVKKGQLVPGRLRRAPTTEVSIRQGRLTIAQGATEQVATRAEVKRAAKRSEALTLGQMLDADRETFYGENRRLYYGSSALLVHFLRHGRPEWSEEVFPTFLLYAVEGFPPSSALEAAYGVEVASLEEPYRQYLIDF